MARKRFAVVKDVCSVIRASRRVLACALQHPLKDLFYRNGRQSRNPLTAFRSGSVICPCPVLLSREPRRCASGRYFFWVPVTALLLVAGSAAAAALNRIDIDGVRVFPESLSSTADGTLYIGGQVSDTVYRALPGKSVAKPWILPGTDGLLAVFGVLADQGRNALWVCSVDRTNKKRLGTSLIRFNLKTGAPEAKYPYPGGGTCNDVTIASDGTLYASDTLNGRVLRLAPSAHAFTDVIKDHRLVGADGIVMTRDGKLYTNTYGTGLLFRVDFDADGRASGITQIKTSQPLVQPDGMRVGADGNLYMAEGQGHVDRVDITGDTATIHVLHKGFQVPSAVTVVGKTIWVTETKFNYQRDPALKGKDPGVFHVYAVPVEGG